MKIMFIIDHFGNGGAERVVSVLSDELVRKGVSVDVVVNFDEKNYELNDNAKYLVTECRHKSSVLRRIDRLVSLRKIIKDEAPDYIFSFGYFMNLYTIAACVGRKRKGVIISERTDPNSEPSKKVLRGIRNLIYRKCNVLVCQTEDAKAYFSAALQKKAVVIPNPVKSGLPLRDCNFQNKTIVNACRLESQKNLPLLIKSFKRVHDTHPDYSLVIYGDGTQRKELEDIIQGLQLNDAVALPGFSKNLHEAMKDCCMFVSSSDYEGISNSMLEAMAMGMPVICTDCPIGGARMVIRNRENGLLVPIKDEEALVQAMNDFIQNREFAEECGWKAKEVRDEFSVEKIAQRWLALCKQ